MRCYNGCPDSKMQAVIDDQMKATKELEDIGATVTYFPMEEKWMAFKDNQAITSFHGTKREAANAVLQNQ